MWPACSQLLERETLASSHAAAALHLYNGHLPAAQQATLLTSLGQQQKQLTKVLDAVGWEAQLSASSLTGRALLLSEAAPGARAFLAARMASSAWSQLFLSRSCAIALASLTLVTMRGAPSAMAFWTAFPSMLVLVRQVGNVRCGTMLSVTLSTSGLRGQVCNQNGRSLVCSQRPEETGLGRRRPADVFVPSLAGIPTTFDIAVTAPQRSESLRTFQASKMARNSLLLKDGLCHRPTAAGA